MDIGKYLQRIGLSSPPGALSPRGPAVAPQGSPAGGAFEEPQPALRGAGQVKNSETGCFGPPFDHLISMVSLGQGVGGGGLLALRRWVWESGFREPLSLETTKTDTGEPQTQGHLDYRIRREEDMHFLECRGEGGKRKDGGEWTGMYKFTLEPRQRENFAEMCDYHQSSPSSIFFCKSLCTIATPAGRLTYIGHRLITTRFPTAQAALNTSKRELQDEEIPGILESEFGVVLTSPLIPKDQEIAPPSVMY
ncbi:hypothetical protein CRUP_001769 [Coryphaenoides rupestris]|nr:hypothetical protein CRUP_001769 [Coryphaenoides rupestris]